MIYYQFPEDFITTEIKWIFKYFAIPFEIVWQGKIFNKKVLLKIAEYNVIKN